MEYKEKILFYVKYAIQWLECLWDYACLWTNPSALRKSNLFLRSIFPSIKYFQRHQAIHSQT